MEERWPINTDNFFGAVSQVYTDLGLLGHNGVDFLTPIGVTILASEEGDVEQAGSAGTAGIMISLRHSFGLTRYLHCSMIYVARGSHVERGQPIGRTGNTGLSTGPHLHWDFHPDSEPESNGYRGAVNPLPFMVSV